jgi:hypothetical protein
MPPARKNAYSAYSASYAPCRQLSPAVRLETYFHPPSSDSYFRLETYFHPSPPAVILEAGGEGLLASLGPKR